MPIKPRKTAPAGCVELRLHGKFEGGAVSTKHVPLSLLTELTEATKAFVKGGESQGLEEDPVVAVVEGPMCFVFRSRRLCCSPSSRCSAKTWKADPARARARRLVRTRKWRDLRGALKKQLEESD